MDRHRVLPSTLAFVLPLLIRSSAAKQSTRIDKERQKTKKQKTQNTERDRERPGLSNHRANNQRQTATLASQRQASKQYTEQGPPTDDEGRGGQTNQPVLLAHGYLPRQTKVARRTEEDGGELERVCGKQICMAPMVSASEFHILPTRLSPQSYNHYAIARSSHAPTALLAEGWG